MYRQSLAALWTGAGVFTGLAIIDAMVDFMGHLQGLFIGGAAACFVGAVLRISLHELNETATINRRKAEQVHDDVDQLRTQVDCLQDKVAEVRDLTEASEILRQPQKNKQTDPEPKPEPEPNAVIYQFRLRNGDHDVIVGS